MHAFRFVSVASAAVLIAAFCASARAQGPPPLGGEFRVSEAQTGFALYPRVAHAPDGAFVVVWFTGVPGANTIVDVYGRRYDAAGVPAGPSFQVNTSPINAPNASVYDRKRSLSVAMGAGGAFVVAWGSNGQDGSGFGIAARRFDATGTPLGAEFQVNTRTMGDQIKPSIAMDAGGAFVVVWQDRSQPSSFFDVEGQRYAASGTRDGSEFRVDVLSGRDQIEPAVAMAPGGAFAVAWTYTTATPGTQIYVRRYSAAGAAQGIPVQANSHTSPFQERPAVAMTSTGAFVVAWVDLLVGQGGGDARDVYARLFYPGGGGNGDDFRVAATRASEPADVATTVGMRADGAFAVVWGRISDAGFSVYARQYIADGIPAGNEFQVNPASLGSVSPAASVDAAGNMVVVWQSNVYAQDGTLSIRIFGQRYSSGIVADEGGAGAVGLALSVAPNPVGAAGTATVRYETAAAQRVRVSVVDALGRTVAVLADGEQAAGPHESRLDTARLAPGVYVVRLEAGGGGLTRRVTIVR